MNQQEITEKALETLANVAGYVANQKPATADRLEAMAKVIANIPWDDVATLSIGWDAGKHIDGDGDEVTEFLPILDVVMKEQLT